MQLALLLLLIGAAVKSALAISFMIDIGSKEYICVYANVKAPEETINFYFYVVQGGSFDIDYKIEDESGTILSQGTKVNKKEISLKSVMAGEHSFCFSNEMSTITDKRLEVEISTDSEITPELPIRQEAGKGFEEETQRVRARLKGISRLQKYFRTREIRNMSTVKSTEARIFWFSIFESVLVVAMAGLQVFIAHFVFSVTRRTAGKV